MMDLSPEERENLINLKPELKSFIDYYYAEGMTDHTLDLLSREMSRAGIPEFDEYLPEKKIFILDSYKNLEHFVRNYYDEVVEGLLDYRDNLIDISKEAVKINSSSIHKFLELLPIGAQTKIFNYLGINTKSYAISDAVDRLLRHGGDGLEAIELAFQKTTDRIRESINEIEQRIKEYVEVGWYFEIDPVNIEFTNTNDIFNSKVLLSINERDLIDIVTAIPDEDGYDEDSLYHQIAASEGWYYMGDTGYDLISRRKEDGLINNKGYDTEYGDVKKLSQDIDDDISIEKAVEIYMNQSAGSSTIRDPNQLSMFKNNQSEYQSDYHELQDLRRRAGIK